MYVVPNILRICGQNIKRKLEHHYSFVSTTSMNYKLIHSLDHYNHIAINCIYVDNNQIVDGGLIAQSIFYTIPFKSS